MWDSLSDVNIISNNAFLETFKNNWNRNVKKPKLRVLSLERRERLVKLLDLFSEEELLELPKKTSEATWLLDKHWFSLDWIINDFTNVENILNGKYRLSHKNGYKGESQIEARVIDL